MAAVRERRALNRWERQEWLFWQTRTLGSIIAATVPIEPGKTNPLMDAVQEIGQSTNDGGDTATPAAEAKTGSFEAFMGSFGSPHRWAGSRG